MLQIIKPHKTKYGINVFATCQRLRARSGLAYLTTSGCQRICSAACDFSKFVPKLYLSFLFDPLRFRLAHHVPALLE